MLDRWVGCEPVDGRSPYCQNRQQECQCADQAAHFKLLRLDELLQLRGRVEADSNTYDQVELEGVQGELSYVW